MSNWYQKCMPQVKDVEPFLKELFSNIISNENVRGVYIWGSYASNKSNPKFRLKDIDVIARTKFNSEDLISVDEQIVQQRLSQDYLENQGYDPFSVKFSQDFVGIKKYNIDHWAISSDRKLLHWGPIIVNREESDSINKEAEKHASDITGLNRKKISKASEEDRVTWYESYRDYLNRFFSNMPTGWYKTEEVKIKDILSEAIKL